MNETQIIHVVEPHVAMRAALARAAYEFGHHAEVYADVAELCEHFPRRGIVLVRDDPAQGGIAGAIEVLARCGVCLPLVAMAEAPDTSRVVAAVKAGALDYLPLPFHPGQLRQMLSDIDGEAKARLEIQRRVIEARDRIGSLSTREREVLDWLAKGTTNKTIARELQISPRTVEIHRANMMAKLGASHAADAVRLRLEASL